MSRKNHKYGTALTFAFAFAVLTTGVASAQTWNSSSGGYNTGYGTVYGTFGQAMATQNIYNTMQMQMQKTMMRNAMIKKWGLAAVEKAEREAASGSSSSRAKASDSPMVVSPPPVVRNHGVFRPDATVDTGKAFADALGDTPEEKSLIKQIYTATKAAYEKEAATKGWQNNIAGGLTLFTVTALVVYRDIEEPSAEAANDYFKVVNAALDEIPEFATVTNKDKQGFNNMLIGFSGLLLAGYLESKQNSDAAALASYKKLAGMLVEMVLKTDPEKFRVEDNQILLK